MRAAIRTAGTKITFFGSYRAENNLDYPLNCKAARGRNRKGKKK
ncbi:hypothetical protein C7382_11110 [Porphyromonas loveana]|uniref:Uncharacterized protein n=1 Tax=Porphyromonas loveana TaxID=1884669 RepID=A0A2U1F991_9PORP|nr:hypothetical protein C7382_11110 [Porphyromonas loveana]